MDSGERTRARAASCPFENRRSISTFNFSASIETVSKGRRLLLPAPSAAKSWALAGAEAKIAWGRGRTAFPPGDGANSSVQQPALCHPFGVRDRRSAAPSASTPPGCPSSGFSAWRMRKRVCRAIDRHPSACPAYETVLSRRGRFRGARAAPAAADCSSFLTAVSGRVCGAAFGVGRASADGEAANQKFSSGEMGRLF